MRANAWEEIGKELSSRDVRIVSPRLNKCINSFIWKTSGRITLGTNSHGCVENVKINHKRKGYESVEWAEDSDGGPPTNATLRFRS
jgi:hypothetical protein